MAVVLVACSGGQSGGADADAGGGACAQDRVYTAEPAVHIDQGTRGEYDTNPPTSGEHWDSTVRDGEIYEAGAVDVEAVVHNMEHGSVVFWTNELPADQYALAEKTFLDIYEQGYSSLIMLEYNEMDVSFAMTAWGALQECTGVDPETLRLMGAFTDDLYGSGGEGEFACEPAEAARLQGCEKWADE